MCTLVYFYLGHHLVNRFNNAYVSVHVRLYKRKHMARMASIDQIVALTTFADNPECLTLCEWMLAWNNFSYGKE